VRCLIVAVRNKIRLDSPVTSTRSLARQTRIISLDHGTQLVWEYSEAFIRAGEKQGALQWAQWPEVLWMKLFLWAAKTIVYSHVVLPSIFGFLLHFTIFNNQNAQFLCSGFDWKMYFIRRKEMILISVL
jgi:hypothetical protein